MPKKVREHGGQVAVADEDGQLVLLGHEGARRSQRWRTAVAVLPEAAESPALRSPPAPGPPAWGGTGARGRQDYVDHLGDRRDSTSLRWHSPGK